MALRPRIPDTPQHGNEFADKFRDSDVSSPVFAGVPTSFNRGSWEDGDATKGLNWQPSDPGGFKPKKGKD